MNQIKTGWWESAATFKKCIVVKVSFIFLCLIDFILTILSLNLGLFEINPLVIYLIQIPVLFLTVKLFMPVIFAWILPGRLLLPFIGLLLFAVIWNIKELVIFLMS